MAYGNTPAYLAVKQALLTTAGGKGYLRCLTDSDGHKLAQRLYVQYISDSDFSKFPSFLMKLDRLFHEYGAKTAKRKMLEEDDERGRNSDKRRRHDKDKKNKKTKTLVVE